MTAHCPSPKERSRAAASVAAPRSTPVEYRMRIPGQVLGHLDVEDRKILLMQCGTGTVLESPHRQICPFDVRTGEHSMISRLRQNSCRPGPMPRIARIELFAEKQRSQIKNPTRVVPEIKVPDIQQRIGSGMIEACPDPVSPAVITSKNEVGVSGKLMIREASIPWA